MKSLLLIAVSLFHLNQNGLGQTSIGYFEISQIQEIILLYLDGRHKDLDSLLSQKGYHKSRDLPIYNWVSTYESFTYTNDTLCSKKDIRVEFSRKHEPSTGNIGYSISIVFYSSSPHESDADKLIAFLKKYAYNAVESTPSNKGLDKYISTNTPESIKRNGSLYLRSAWLYIMDGSKPSTTYCGLQYRMKYDMNFCKGYASLDSVGYVSTKEGSDLRLRNGPSLNSDIITGIPDGSKIFIVEYSDAIEFVSGAYGNWYKIKYKDQTGWVWGNFIRLENEE